MKARVKWTFSLKFIIIGIAENFLEESKKNLVEVALES